jgi:hypothetical protein
MARNYRIRGVPLEWNADQVRGFLAENSRDEPPLLHSLAREIHGRSQSATISFQNVDSTLPRQTRLPMSNQFSRPQIITIDDNFHGITTLHIPPRQNHCIE